MSQRAFAESIGLQPTSLAAIFSLKKTGTVTQVLANSVELKHGYRAEWIIKGKEPKTIKNKPLTIDYFYYSCLGLAAGGLHPRFELLVSSIERGLFAVIDKEIMGIKRNFDRKNKKEFPKMVTTRGNKLDRLIHERSVIMDDINRIFKTEIVQIILFRFYMVFFENKKDPDIDFEYFDLKKNQFSKKAKTLCDELIAINQAMYDLWEE